MARKEIQHSQPDNRRPRAFAISKDYEVSRLYLWIVFAGPEPGAPILARGLEAERETALERAEAAAGPRAVELESRVVRRRRRDALGDRRHPDNPWRSHRRRASRAPLIPSQAPASRSAA